MQVGDVRQTIFYPGIQNNRCKSPQLNVLGIGSCIVDLSVRVEDQFLEVLCAKKGEAKIVPHETFSQFQQMKPSRSSGGSCANTIKGLAQLGQKSVFFGKIGSDDSGRYFQDCLIAHKVQPLLLQSTTHTTQAACLITPDKERTPIVFLGAEKELQGHHLSSDLFCNAKLLHLDGYSLRNEQLFEQAVQLAKQAEVLVSFDLACVNVVNNNKELLLRLCSRTMLTSFSAVKMRCVR